MPIQMMLNHVSPLWGVLHGPLCPQHILLNQFSGNTQGLMGCIRRKYSFWSCRSGAMYEHIRAKKDEMAKAS
jgi:hypothetical protein